jgi:hypothetical protein
MRNPIENQPAYFSDNGVNSAAFSLRMIMAEQEQEEKNKKNVSNDFNNKNNNIKYDPKIFSNEFNYNLTKKFNEKNFDYLNFASNENDLIEKSNEYRSLASKYSNLKQENLKKAAEAYKRGFKFFFIKLYIIFLIFIIFMVILRLWISCSILC